MAKRKKGKGAKPYLDHGAKAEVVSKRLTPRPWALAAVALIVMAVAYLVHRFGFDGADKTAIPVAPGTAAGVDVVLITLDTLRADRLECYGYRGVQTPSLNGLAARGVRFDDAVAGVPLTLPSHASILTGNYPPKHGVRDNGIHRLVPQQITLAERLRDEGYATAAFIGSFVLDRRYGTDQGFELYDDLIENDPDPEVANSPWRSRPDRRGDRVVDSALKWFDQRQRSGDERPFFLWLHLYDPHAPYDPPEPFKSQFASNGYDGEVAFTDHQVGRFLDGLREHGRLETTLLVAVGDHGEGLGDHGEKTHGRLMYEATLRVPLIFHAPALLPKGLVVDDQVVATVDIKPTVLDLLGYSPDGCDGVSLLRQKAEAGRAVYIETLTPMIKHGWSALYGLRRHTDKFIEAPRPEYYDLADDPTETRNRYGRDGPGARLQADLAAMLESFPEPADVANATVALDSETARKLTALGYVTGETKPVVGPPPDPKDMVALWDRQTERAEALMSQKRPGDALPILEELISNTPGDSDLWSMLAVAQAEMARFQEALESRLKSIELHPTDPNHWIHLAQLQFTLGDLEAFQESLGEAERLEPDHGGIYLLRARRFLFDQRYGEAIAQCEEARRHDPSRSTSASWLLESQIYEAMGQPDRARDAFTKARGANPSY